MTENGAARVDVSVTNGPFHASLALSGGGAQDAHIGVLKF